MLHHFLKKIVFISCWLLSFVLSSQTYVFDNYSLPEGLPQTQVRGVVEDHQGKLWIGTLTGGVAIFDGYTFDQIDFGDIRFLRVESIHKNGIGQILVASTSNTLFYLFDEKNPKEPIKTYELEDQFTGTISAGKDCFYISSAKKGLYKISDTELIKLSSSNQATLVQSVHSTNNYVIIENDLFELKGDDLTKISSDSNYVNLNFQDPVWMEKNGKLWYTETTGFSSYHNGKVNHFDAQNGGTDQEVKGMAFQGDSIIWMVLEYTGLGKYTNQKMEVFSPMEDKSRIRYNGIFMDSDDRIWTMGDGSGLHLFKGEKITNYKSDDKVLVAETWYFTEDKEGTIWAGTHGGGLVRIKDGVAETYNKQLGIPDKLIVNSIKYSFEEECLYVGSNLGLYKIKDGQTVNISKKHGINITNGIFDIALVNDKVYFLGGINRVIHLFLYDGENIKSITTSTREKSGRLDALHVIDGKLYVAGTNLFGVLVDDDNIKRDHRLHGRDFGYALDIDNHDGNLYIATNRGLLIIDKSDQVHLLSKKDGMNSFVSFFVQVDDKGRVWAGHEKGVDIIEFDNNFNIKNVKLISDNEGLQGMETNQGSGFIDSKGNVWIGTIIGISKYDPRYEKKNSLPPSLFIKDLKIYYESVDWNTIDNINLDEDGVPISPKLHYDQNHITVDVSAINLSNPRSVRYQYYLEGYDGKWSPETELNTVTYTNLEPGAYSLKIKARNEDNVWTDEYMYHFIIEPPIWAKTWFKLTVLLSILTITLTWVKLRERKLKIEKELLQAKVASRTKEILNQKNTLEEQKEVIEKKNSLITDSLDYAQKIQSSILPSKHMFGQFFEDHFILFKPKDIVSGDFYWMRVVGNWALVACVDCTGHGVPGAFMSIISQNILDISTNSIEQSDLSPAHVLTEAKARMQIMKDKYYDDSMLKDGMAISLLAVNITSKKALYAGSYHSLYYLRDGNIIEYKGDRIPIGHKKFHSGDEGAFHESSFHLRAGDQVYMFTDGFADQKGGEKNKKYFYGPLRDLLIKNAHLSMQNQKEALINEFSEWKGENEQYDDVLMIGLKV